jgi:hypothetical protein
MAVVSYKIACLECSTETVIRDKHIDSSVWSVKSKIHHDGTCPRCNPTIDVDNLQECGIDYQEVPFSSLDHIGESGADNLRERGIVTRKDVKEHSDDEILATPWVGEKGLKSIRNRVR